MSSCQPFTAEGPAGIADALQTVDCFAFDAVSSSFGRLFGPGGGLSTALTVLLTLYIALLAVNLLTGRSAIRLSMFTPRMMSLGLVITFVTSWVAYQTVVWNLAVGAPDEIAGILVGSRESATALFARRLDVLFGALGDAAAAMSPGAAQGASAALASPVNLLWLSALMLVLATVGVLVLCRLALAALLILGPVFIVLALFDGTRGLFEGWLKTVAMFALAPLLTVVMGSGMLLALNPMVAGLQGGEVPVRVAVTIFVASVVYVALMGLVMNVAGTLTRGWRLPRANAAQTTKESSLRTDSGATSVRLAAGEAPAAAAISSDRVRSTLATLSAAEPGRLELVRVGSTVAGEVLAPVDGHSSHGPSHRPSLLLACRTQPNSSRLPRELIR